MKRMLSLMIALLLPLLALAEMPESMMPLRVKRFTRDTGTEALLQVPSDIVAWPDPAEVTTEPVTQGDLSYWGTPAAAPSGATYHLQDLRTQPEGRTTHLYTGAILTKSVEGQTVWSVQIDGYWVKKVQELHAGVLLLGATDLHFTGAPDSECLTLVSHEGEALWTQQLDCTAIDEVLENGDGTLTVFSRNHRNLCVWRLGAEGQVLRRTETSAADFGAEKPAMPVYVRQALPTGTGHLLLTSDDSGRYAILRLNGEDSVTEAVTFESANGFLKSRAGAMDSWLTAKDLCLSGGSLWLSGYLTEEGRFGSHGEIVPALQAADALNFASLTGDRSFLTPWLRNCYTAVLLRIDPETLQPLQAWIMPQCLGGTLAGQEDGVIWDAEYLVSSFYSPFTSAFTVSGVAQVYRYAFGVDGALQGGGLTEEFVHYIR